MGRRGIAAPIVVGVAVLSALLLVRGGDRRALYGQYVSCPRPAFSTWELRLSASGAHHYSFYDYGPVVTELSGEFQVESDRLSLEFTKGSIRSGAQEKPLGEPLMVVLEVRDANGTAVLGPIVEYGSGEATRLDQPGALFLLYAAPLGAQVPGELACPAEVERWQTEVMGISPAA